MKSVCLDTITDLRVSAPGKVKCATVLGYHAPGDGGGGDFYWDASNNEDENGGTVIVSQSGPPTGRWKRVIEGPVSIKWFGAMGDGNPHPLVPNYYPTLSQAQAVYPHAISPDDQIDWAAAQATLNRLHQGTTTGNHIIFVPAGTYFLSHTLSPPDSSSHWQLVGEGKLASQFRWAGPSGVPVIKLLNARSVVLKDFGLFGRSTLPGSGIPSHGVLVHKSDLPPEDPAPAFNVFERLSIGNHFGEVIENGIAYTAENYATSDAHDSNNEQGTFIDVNIENVEQYGLSFEHSNSLLHKIYGGAIVGNQAAINNVGPNGKPGGSFMLFGTALATKTYGCIFRLGMARHAISIVAAAVESEGALLTTPCPMDPDWALRIEIIGGSFIINNGDDDEVLFDSSEGGHLTMTGAYFLQELKLKFPGSGRVVFRDTDMNLVRMAYNGVVLLDNCSNTAGPGAFTFTNLGHGKLTITNPRRNLAHPQRYRLSEPGPGKILELTGPTPSLAGYDYFEACYNTPTLITNFLDGYDTKEVAIYFCNDKASIANNQHILTPDQQDIAFPPNGGFVRLRKTHRAFGKPNAVLWLVENVLKYT